MKSILMVIASTSFFASSLLAQVVQTEPNDSIGTATPSTLAAGSSGGIFSNGNNGDGSFGPTTGNGTGDFDFFSVPAIAGQTIIFDTNSSVLGTAVDTLIGIYDMSGTLVASNDDDGTTRDSFVSYTVPADGTYYPVVGNWIPGAASDADSLPTDPNTPGTGRGAPGGGIDTYEAVIMLDGAVYFTHNIPAFPISAPTDQASGSVTLTNQGNSTANITGLNITGPGASAFSVTQAAPLSVGAGASTTLEIVFDPSGSSDPFEATLEVVSDDIIHPTLSIALQAKAIEGLLFRLPFDDPAGSGTGAFGVPAETSGNGFQAAMIVNAGAPPPVFGRPSIAGSEGFSTMFNDAGSSGNFVLTANGFPHTATFTYSVWVRPTGGAGEDTLFNRDPAFGLGDAVYGCSIADDGTVRFRIAGGDTVFSDPGAVPDDSIHHIVVTHLDSTGFGDFNANRTRLYIDGVLVSENLSPAEVPEYFGAGNTRLWIGTRSAAGTGFNGDMDDFQLYITELSAVDVKELFDNPGSALGDAPRAPFAITNIVRAMDGSSAEITWNSREDRNYAVESSVDMKEWEELDDSVASSGESTTYTVGGINASTTRLYIRVREAN